MMARSLVFTNSNSESITFERSPYLITNIEGLGIPSVEVQEQRSPFIDGTTEIDNVIEARDIVMTISIIAPNDFTNIDTYRRDIIKKLNPKLNAGTIIYTTEGGDSYRIVGTPTSVVFRGKVYGEPFQECQIIFHCHDPYWTAVNSTTENLTTIFGSNEITVYNGGIFEIDAVTISDTTIGCLYRRGGLGIYATFSTDNGDTWSAGQLVLAFDYRYYKLLKDNNGVIRLFYARAGDSTFRLCMRTTSDLITWTSEVQISTDAAYGIDAIQDLNGFFRVIYHQNPSTVTYAVKSVSSADGTTWGSPSSSIVDAIDIALVQTNSGKYIIFYNTPTDDSRFVTSTDFSTWTSYSTLISGDYNGAISASITPSGDIKLFTKVKTDDTLIELNSTDEGTTWSAASVVLSFVYADANVLYIPNGIYLIFYSSTIAAVKKSGSLLTNISDVTVPCYIVFNGPCINPRIENTQTGEYIRIVKTITQYDYFTIDTTPGNKTVRMFINGVETNGTAYLDISSTFFQIDPNGSTVVFSDETPSGTTATATVTYRERYAGI